MSTYRFVDTPGNQHLKKKIPGSRQGGTTGQNTGQTPARAVLERQNKLKMANAGLFSVLEL